uniref:T-complex protein 1 subunit alpha n=1 Tax=Tetrahymena pyriformis TaxID=5908 RepID=Q9XZD7_TETPY|nr:chaperonin-containing-TCP1 theta subunit [Tetrahymena pyriformis]
MSLQSAYGINSLLKEGHRHFSGMEEALLKNINACKEISNMTKTSLGPNGMKKMVINHLDKIFVTSDAATIMQEMEVQHPAAKMIVMASKMQENECGDATNLVIALAGELLSQAESLIKMGLHPSQIITGYEQALKAAIELLNTLSVFTVEDPTNLEQVSKALKASLSSKLIHHADFFAQIVAQACINSKPENDDTFDLEFVRVAKILGASIEDSYVQQGLIITRNAEGSITRVSNPKVAVYSCPLDTQQAETKGTVLIQNAKELLNYTKSEESHAESIVKKIADSGINLIIAGGSISEIVLHYVEKYKMMIVKCQSKFELKRICKALGACPVARLDAPNPEEIGFCDSASVEEIGSQKVTIIKKENQDCKLNTIILRGSTINFLDDIERAIDDGVNVYRCLLKDGKFAAGAGATEAVLSHKLQQQAKSLEDLSQYAFNRFALSFEIIPRILSDNAGLNSNEIIPKLNTANKEESYGIDIENGTIRKSSELAVYDHLQSKIWAVRLAADAAITILKVDQIVIAKQAGGPKMNQQQGHWDEE